MQIHIVKRKRTAAVILKRNGAPWARCLKTKTRRAEISQSGVCKRNCLACRNIRASGPQCTGHKEAHYRPQRASLPVLKTVFGTAKCRVSQSRRRHFAHGKAANHTAVGCPMPQRPWPKAPRKAVSRLGTVLFKMTH